MKLINRTLLLTFLAITTFLSAQGTPPPPPLEDQGGGVGPGAPSSPIDMYVYVLAVVAIIFIVYHTRKIMLRKAL